MSPLVEFSIEHSQYFGGLVIYYVLSEDVKQNGDRVLSHGVSAHVVKISKGVEIIGVFSRTLVCFERAHSTWILKWLIF